MLCILIPASEHMHILPVAQVFRLIKQDDATPVSHSRAKHHIPPIVLAPRRWVAKAIDLHACWWLCDYRRIQLCPGLQFRVGRSDQTLRFPKTLRAAFARGLILRYATTPVYSTMTSPFWMTEVPVKQPSASGPPAVGENAIGRCFQWTMSVLIACPQCMSPQ